MRLPVCTQQTQQTAWTIRAIAAQCLAKGPEASVGFCGIYAAVSLSDASGGRKAGCTSCTARKRDASTLVGKSTPAHDLWVFEQARGAGMYLQVPI